jgi:hypothetical protein
MSDLDSYYWKLLDAYLEEHFVEHEDAMEGFNQEQLDKFMSTPDWVGIRCHYK